MDLSQRTVRLYNIDLLRVRESRLDLFVSVVMMNRQ